MSLTRSLFFGLLLTLSAHAEQRVLKEFYVREHKMQVVLRDDGHLLSKPFLFELRAYCSGFEDDGFVIHAVESACEFNPDANDVALYLPDRRGGRGQRRWRRLTPEEENDQLSLDRVIAVGILAKIPRFEDYEAYEEQIRQGRVDAQLTCPSESRFITLSLRDLCNERYRDYFRRKRRGRLRWIPRELRRPVRRVLRFLRRNMAPAERDEGHDD